MDEAREDHRDAGPSFAGKRPLEFLRKYFLTTRSEIGTGEREMGNSERMAKSFYIRALEPKTEEEWLNSRP